MHHNTSSISRERFVTEEREREMSKRLCNEHFWPSSWVNSSSYRGRVCGQEIAAAHVKENKRSILDGPFVEGLARGFYVEREGGRGRRGNREILASSVNWGCSIAKSRIRRLIRAKIVPFQTVSKEETRDWIVVVVLRYIFVRENRV